MNVISFIKKRKWWLLAGAAVLILVAYFLFFKKAAPPQTITVTKGDFLQQVSVSGKVTAAENLDLSFEQSGIITSVPVKVGDQVVAGKLLAAQDTAQLSVQLAQMQAGIDLQKAKLAQLLAGSSDQDIAIATDKVTAATQDVANAYANALLTLGSAYNYLYAADTVAATMQNTYFTDYDQQGLKVQAARLAVDADVADAKKLLDAAKQGTNADVDRAVVNILVDLQNAYANMATIRDQADIGVYYTRITATDKATLDTQKTNLTTAANSVSSAQQDLGTYAIALKQAQNNLDSVKAPARQTDIAVYEAQIRQAQASAQDVVTQIRKRQIYAPIAATVTAVNAKVGSIMAPSDIAVSLISAGNFQIESYVPEIYISLISLGNDTDITLDAFGPDKIFKAKVATIDPSETIKDGVSTYKITLALADGADQVKSGMSANVVITTEKKSNVISVPQGAIISKGTQKFVNVLIGKTTTEKEITVGEVSSNGQAEITSGLSEGDVVVTGK